MPIDAQTHGDMPSADRLEFAMKLLDAMQFDRYADRMYGSPGAATNGMTPAAAARLRAFHETHVTPARVRPSLAAAYARRFSVDELRQLIQFYESRVGQKLLEEQPAISREGGAVIAQIYTEHADAFRRAITGQPPGE
jgi:hypothetical protein